MYIIFKDATEKLYINIYTTRTGTGIMQSHRLFPSLAILTQVSGSCPESCCTAIVAVGKRSQKWGGRAFTIGS